MNTGKLTAPFRKLGLMHTLDWFKFRVQKLKFRKKNNQFKQAYSTVVLPPDYLMFESYKLDYHKYYFGGKESAADILNDVKKYIELKNVNILDWGCGPARILRHLPELVGNGCIYYGTDYNEKTINWCAQNIPNIDFRRNQLQPPLSYSAASFDFLYGISIFTHLSKENHYKWFDELMRVTKKGSIILLTTAGAAFKEIMTEQEQKDFDNEQLITRGNVVEGHRVYASFQPPAFLHQLFNTRVDVVEHIAGKRENWGINQDKWILKKR